MAEKGQSAEKQLLELIENSGGEDKAAQIKKGGSKKNVRAGKIARRRPYFLSLSGLRPSLSALKEKIKKASDLKDTENVIDFTRNALVVFIYFLFFVISLGIIRDSKAAKQLPNLIPIEKGTGALSLELNRSESFSFYADKLRQRNLFSVTKKEETPKAEAKRRQEEPILEKIRKNLRLVGLSPSRNKEDSYAMLEDITKGTTFFIKKGESILGYTVKDITNEKVVFTDGRETAELR